MSGSEILGLARRAGVGPGVRVLDLCCGVGGPGRLVAATTGCCYLGVDSQADAVGVAVARDRVGGLDCRFEVGTVPPVRFGTFDVVLLLEAFLAVPDKPALVREVSRALPPGGRFAFTVEVGRPLTEPERQDMPGADTVWPVPRPELVSMLAAVGLDVRRTVDCTRAHRLAADALADAFEADRAAVSAELGEEVVDRLVTSHRLWSDWMATGRIRKVAGVAQLVDGGASPP
jgi:SAM-dependent methyltransferase